MVNYRYKYPYSVVLYILFHGNVVVKETVSNDNGQRRFISLKNRTILKNRAEKAVNRSMRAFKYVGAVWTAAAVYLLFSFVGGPSGISAYKIRLSERDRQLANMKELGYINEEMEKVKNGLLYDHDMLLVYARRMGYSQENERFIRIVGLGNVKNTPSAAGEVYIAQEPDFILDKDIKITALFTGLAVFILLFFLEKINSGRY
jgi:cell division protein FtsB